jgi:purine catabolism regulatory family protein/PucR-like helix-turn-helix protein/diguanylate cyclase with GGDEF domain
VRVSDLLNVPGLGLRLLTGAAGTDRAIRRVFTTDLPDPSRYLTPGVLVLTGLIWCRGPGDADRFVSALGRAGVAALGAGEALGAVPAEVIQACARHGIPLLAVPPETSFAAITEEVGQRLSGDRATAMTRVLGRRRLLLSAVAEGAGLDAMFRLMSRELGAECWLLTGLGRVVGGTGPSLPGPLALGLAGEYLGAGRLPAVAEVTAPGLGGGTYSLVGVGGEPRITSWFLACAGREQDWPHELRESVAELAADVALERARLDAARTGDRKLAEAIVGMLAAGGEGAAPAEIASLMRAAGLPPDGRYVVVALAAETDRGTGQNDGRWSWDLAAELAVPLAEGALAAPLGEEVILLIPVLENTVLDNTVPDTAASEDAASEHVFADRIRETDPVVAADRSQIRVTAGVSAPAQGVTALAGALHEAGSARRLAALRSGGEGGAAAVSVVTSDEVASHELLLATVPPSVLRSFRTRLLGPLLAYDDRHRAELLPTLREFLACSGSWNACAAKMYVHVNTVRYRIRRIEELTGRDLSSLNDQVDFYLALQIR